MAILFVAAFLRCHFVFSHRKRIGSLDWVADVWLPWIVEVDVYVSDRRYMCGWRGRAVRNHHIILASGTMALSRSSSQDFSFHGPLATSDWIDVSCPQNDSRKCASLISLIQFRTACRRIQGFLDQSLRITCHEPILPSNMVVVRPFRSAVSKWLQILVLICPISSLRWRQWSSRVGLGEDRSFTRDCLQSFWGCSNTWPRVF